MVLQRIHVPGPPHLSRVYNYIIPYCREYMFQVLLICLVHIPMVLQRIHVPGPSSIFIVFQPIHMSDVKLNYNHGIIVNTCSRNTFNIHCISGPPYLIFIYLENYCNMCNLCIYVYVLVSYVSIISHTAVVLVSNCTILL